MLMHFEAALNIKKRNETFYKGGKGNKNILILSGQIL